MQARPLLLALLKQFTEEHPGWAAVCWGRDAEGQLQLQLERGLNQYVMQGKYGISAPHQKRLNQVLQDGETMQADQRQEGHGLLPHVSSVTGLRRAGAIVGAVELLAPASVDPEQSGGRTDPKGRCSSDRRRRE